jgi:hypothetical protein
MVEAARTKDDLADLINVALEELVRCRFEQGVTLLEIVAQEECNVKKRW